MQEGIAGHNGRNLTYHVAYYISLLAQIHAAGGNLRQALALCLDARQRVEATAEAYWSAELHRTEGELRRAAGGAPSEIEACFRMALELSRAQGARMFELRAATGLARLYAGEGRRTQARDLIGPVYQWFTEGFDTADLKDARALLDALA
jgi:predicted ATPase